MRKFVTRREIPVENWFTVNLYKSKTSFNM